MNAYQRRSNVTRLTFEQAMTIRQLAAALDADKNIIRQDIRALQHRGVVRPDGWDQKDKLRTYRATRVVLADELSRNTCNAKPEVSRAFDIENIPHGLRLMFGYTELEPKGGRKIDNSEFMPTPVRVAPVKVYPGTSWGDVALRMPFA
jgi:transposase-like protein